MFGTFSKDADRAIDEISRSLRLNPVGPDLGFALGGLAYAFLIKGDYEKALDYARRTTREMPHLMFGWRLVAVASVKADRLQEAKDAIQQILLLSPNHSIAQARPAFIYRDEWVCEMLVDGLRKAGLPE